MSILYKNAKRICQDVSKTVNDLHNGLAFYTIPHHEGQRYDALMIEVPNFSGHKAEQFVRRIISNTRTFSEETGFLGTGFAFEQGLFGLSYKPMRISLLTVNIDNYEDTNALKNDLFHHLWLALDKDRSVKNSEHAGQYEHTKYPIKADKMELTRRYLKADIFSSLMQAFNDIPDSCFTLGRMRAEQTVQATATHKANFYAYPLAMESCQFLIEDMSRIPQRLRDQISIGLKLTEDVCNMVSDEAIQSWWAFTEPAATMAWLDYSAEEILSACVNSGQDPLIRANGLLLKEILEVELLSPAEIQGIYNSFGEKEELKELHEQRSDTSFEEALGLGMKAESNRPFLDEALFQNERLSQGKALGWTASALQASAKAFDKALKAGRAPEQAARLEYEGVKSKSDWNMLEDLSLKILEARQDGETTTLQSVIDNYGEDQDYRNILDSFEKTLEDPAYTKTLSVDPELNKEAAMKPEGPAPQAPGPKTPAAAPAMSMGIGGPGGGGVSQPLRATKPLGTNNSQNDSLEIEDAQESDAS